MRAVVAVLLCVTAAHAALWGVLREKQQAPDFRGVLPSVSYAPFEGSGKFSSRLPLRLTMSTSMSMTILGDLYFASLS